MSDIDTYDIIAELETEARTYNAKPSDPEPMRDLLLTAATRLRQLAYKKQVSLEKKNALLVDCEKVIAALHAIPSVGNLLANVQGECGKNTHSGSGFVKTPAHLTEKK